MFAPEGQAACIFNVTCPSAVAILGIATAVAATAPALAAVLKNLRLEEFELFNDFFSLIIISPLIIS
jgi:high-affinity Fe2+/Pb2+ permease